MKKADFSLSDADHLLYFLLIILPILLIITGVLIYFTGTYDYAISGVLPTLEYKVHENVLVKDCLAVKEHRTYTGIIDIQKFNEDNMQTCLKLERASQLAITAELYIVEDSRDLIWESDNLALKSPRFRERFTYPVRVLDGDELKTGLLRLTYLK